MVTNKTRETKDAIATTIKSVIGASTSKKKLATTLLITTANVETTAEDAIAVASTFLGVFN